MSEAFDLAGAAGRLEALLDRPEGAPVARAVLAHPHPLRGGTMHNTVVFRTAKALAAAGVEVLRFNFRGVGASAGSHDGGPGETTDVAAALGVLAARGPEPLVAAGYSFGAVQALRAGSVDPRVAVLVAIGLPVLVRDLEIGVAPVKPLIVVQGELDPFGTPDDVRARLAAAPAAEIVAIEGAGHFFEGQAPRVADAVARFVAAHVR